MTSIFDKIDRNKVNQELKELTGYYKNDDEHLCVRCCYPLGDLGLHGCAVMHEHPEQCILALSAQLVDALKLVGSYNFTAK